MGLFDGQIRTFAQKFCGYLDERIGARVEQSKKAEDPTNKLLHLTIAMTLQEVVAALKFVAEIE